MRTHFGRYSTLSRLGAGSFGDVFLAHDPDLDRQVAIKVVEAKNVGAEGLALLTREARNAAGLQHPNLVAVYDVGRDEELAWVVMEHVSGETLRARMDRGPLESGEAARLGAELCGALRVAHARGVIHRDVKPANILLTPEGSPKLADFGLARAPGGSSLSGSGGLVGTILYVSPEQAMGEKIDGRADLFSLAVVLFEAITGRCPFERESAVSSLYAILHESHEQGGKEGEISDPRLAEFFRRALSKDVAGRYADADAFAAALLEAIAPRSPSAEAQPDIGPAPAPRPRFESRLVGRAVELGRLRSRLDEAREGRGGAAILAGEAGIGKSRLLSELTQIATSQGMRVLRGRAVLEGGPAYHPWSLILGEGLGSSGQAAGRSLDAFLERHPDFAGPRAASLRRLLHLGREGAPDDDVSGPDQIWDAVVATLQALSAERPMLVLLDDLHWADPASLKLFRYAGAHAEGRRWLLLGAFRPEEAEGQPGDESVAEIVRLMGREEEVETIPLKRLDRDAAGEMLLDLLHDEPRGANLGDRVYRETEGNPLFILEVAKLLASGEEGAGDLSIPPRVVDVVQHRLDRLTQEERDALEVAAVEGEFFHVGPIARVLGLTRIRALKMLQGLESRHRLVSPAERRFRFDHAKIRDVILMRVPEELRREYHRAVAEALVEERAEVRSATLAQHWDAAGEPAKALPYRLAAAKEARQVFANDEALRHLQAALATLDSSSADPEARRMAVGVRLSKGEVHLLIGNFKESAAMFESAARSAEAEGLAELLARARMGVGEAWFALSDYEPALRMLEDAGRIAESAGAKAILNQVFAATARLHTRRGDFDSALAACKRSEELCRELGSEDHLVQSLLAAGDILAKRGSYEESRGPLQSALEIASRSANLPGQARAHNLLAALARETGDFSAALEQLQQAGEICRRIGDRQGEARTLANSANLHLNRGNWAEAREAYESALKSFRALGDRHAEAIVLNNMAVACSGGGDYEEASRVGADCLDLMRDLQDRWGTTGALDNLGLLLHRRGRAGEARRLLREATQTRRELEDPAGLVESLISLAMVERAHSNPAAAAACAREVLEAAPEGDEARGVAQGLLALCGAVEGAPARRTAAEGMLRTAEAARDRGDVELACGRSLAALELLADLGDWRTVESRAMLEAGHAAGRRMRYEEAWARLLLAQASFQLGRDEGARQEARQALKLADESDLWGIHWEVAAWQAEHYGEEDPEAWRTAGASIERYVESFDFLERAGFLERAKVVARLEAWADRARRVGQESAVRSLEGAMMILG